MRIIEKIENFGRRYYSHFLFWLCFYSIDLYLENHNGIYEASSIPRYFLGIALFYILLKLFTIKNLTVKIAIFILFLLISLILKYQTINLSQAFSKPTLNTQILFIIDNFIHLVALAWLYILLQNLRKKHQQEIALEQHMNKLEIEYLDEKIDGHFFNNTITIFYSYFFKHDKGMADRIIKITDFVKKSF